MGYGQCFYEWGNIISRQKLKEAAIKKTIYVSNSDTVQLVLFAENLGTIPPIQDFSPFAMEMMFTRYVLVPTFRRMLLSFYEERNKKI
jgi:hypothetical protein